MTENPLYRRGYVDSPFQQQQYWRPPSNEYAVRYNQNPNAAQDLRNLFGNFFAQNAAQNYSPQYQPPRYSDYYQTMPQVKQSVKKTPEVGSETPAFDAAIRLAQGMFKAPD